MNTPLKKRYSSASEYGTPTADESENSLYFSFSVDDSLPNKENSISQSPASSLPSTSKAKTPLLRKVLQSNFTPRNANNKRVSFSHLPKQIPAEENTGKIAKITHVHEHQNSNAMFDLEPIKESVQKIFDEQITDQDANDLIDDDDDEMHNTIIENHSSVKHSPEEATSSESIVVMEATNPKIDSKVEKKLVSEVATKIQNRKSVLPIAKKPMRATTYKRRSSTYEPRKVNISKSVSAVHAANAKPTVKMVTSTNRTVTKPQLPKLTAAATRQSFVKRRETKYGIMNLGLANTANPTAIPSTSSLTSSSAKPTVKPVTSTNGIVTKRSSMAQVPKLAVAATRQTMNGVTKHGLANATNATAIPSTSSSTALAKPEFRIPHIALRANKTAKCQYCDKCFVKSQAMTTHLLEKCEKIPAVVRRQLLKKAEVTNDVTSKQKQRESLRHESDSILKYSRFFVNVSNGDASDLQSDEVEKGLKNLRAELRKTKGGHSGIIRTPSKTLRCHICSKHFLDCVDYAEHISNHEA